MASGLAARRARILPPSTFTLASRDSRGAMIFWTKSSRVIVGEMLAPRDVRPKSIAVLQRTAVRPLERQSRRCSIISLDEFLECFICFGRFFGRGPST